ncbi:MAG: hypothetical protein NUV61_03980 [Candidatus Azambacteria bacterium]|nr:hypothetical protein [Candidatus Azambacteria bacterium]
MHDTRKQSKIEVMITAMKEVFHHNAHILLAAGASSAILLLVLWLPHSTLIAQIARDTHIPTITKVKIPLLLLGGIRTNFSYFSASYTIAISILFGMNLAMITYLFRKRKPVIQQGGIAVGFGGMVSGVLGVGCAACGSLVLTSILSVAGASSVLVFLPLQGSELGIISIVLLIVSLFFVSREIITPLQCKIDAPL